MKTYKFDDAALTSKDACMKAMSSLEQAKKDDDVEEDDFVGAKKKIEAAMKKFDGDEGGDEGGDGDAEMSARTCRGETVELAAKSDEGKQVWIQVAKPGKFQGHAAGAFEMNAQTFSEIVHNFGRSTNRAVPVDFEHASEQGPTEGSIPVLGAPAQGWITKLELRSDGNLWGLVQWGDLAKKYIRAGQYKFLSPAIVFGSKDRVTGKPIGARLSSVALTNNPFLDGMQPIAAKHREPGSAARVDGDVVKTICSALALPPYADARLACMTMQSIEGMHVQPPPGVAANFAATQATALRDALRLPLTMPLTEVFAIAREACGEVLLTNVIPPVPADLNTHKPVPANKESIMDNAKEKELETTVSQLTLKLNAAESEKKTLLTESETKISQLTLKNAELQTQLDQYGEREVTGLVDNAIQVWGEKRGLTAELRPHLMRMAKNDREGFMALYPTVPAGQRHLATNLTGNHNVPGQQLGTGGGGEGNNVIRLREVIADNNIPDVETLATKLMSDAKVNGGVMSREEAYSKAHTQRTNLINAAANKRLAGNGS